MSDLHRELAELHYRQTGQDLYGIKGKTMETPEIEDLGTPELRLRLQTSEIKTEKGKRQTRVDVQVPLDYYKLREWITAKQFQAGDLFYKKWRSGAVKSHYSQMRYATEFTLASLDYADRTPEEMRVIMEWEYKAARNSMGDNETKALVYRVCCLGEWAREAKLPEQKVETAMRLLRRGLDQLGEHFGL